MAFTGVSLEQRSFGQTLRRDAWWVQPLLVFLYLLIFVVYATWAAFQGEHYEWGPYISPFYSPLIFGDSVHSWFGAKPTWLPSWISPALLILWVPAGFRLTCYYYRGAYYKAFWADPPSCTVGEPRSTYRGEHFFPLIMQNAHRYFLYVTVPFLVILLYDVWEALWFVDTTSGDDAFGVGLGTVILGINVIFLGGYTFGCHSLRHLIGGGIDELSKFTSCFFAYRCVSRLNRRHMLWGWLSLSSVMFSDLYVRMCSMGIWSDWRVF